MSDTEQISQEAIEDFHAHLAELQERHGMELDEDQAEEIAQASLAEGFTEEATETAFEEAAGNAARQNYVTQSLEMYERQIGRELDPEEAQMIVEHAVQYPDDEGEPDMAEAIMGFHQLAPDEPDEPDEGDEAEAEAGWETSFQTGIQRLEQELGRELLAKEVEELYEKLPDEGEPDVAGVWKDTAGRDGDPYDHDNSHKRSAWIAGRFQEQHEDEPATEVQRPSDDAKSGEWVDYMAARMNGAEVAESDEPDEPAEAA